MFKFNKKILNLTGLISSIILMALLPFDSAGQINNNIEKYLLSASEIDGYKLKSQYFNDWIVGENNKLQKTILQTWIPVESEQNLEILIETCVFSSISDAITGTAYNSGSYANGFICGGYKGHIYGDGSWLGLGNSDNATTLLVRGNVGVMIGVLYAEPREIEDLGEWITEKALGKVEDNLTPEIVAYEQSLKPKQISLDNYNKLTDSVANSNLMQNFSQQRQSDSKWLTDNDGVTLGIRKEWINEKGTVIAIDICQFESASTASRASNIMSQNTCFFNNLVDPDQLDSLKDVISKFKKFDIRQSIAVVAAQQNLAWHIYLADTSGVDHNFFFSLVEKLVQEFSNF